MKFSRRNFIASASTLLATSATAARAEPPAMIAKSVVQPLAPPNDRPQDDLERIRASGIRPDLFAAALAALERHGARVKRDRIGIIDFSAPSSAARFHLVDLEKNTTDSLLVSHGSGSDPDYSGWLQTFSNRPGSNATSEGAYATSNYYVGKHGRSQRLLGLDSTNSNALDRAIVIHSAWYAEPEIAQARGKLGRSQGCFALSRRGLDQVFGHLGEGRLIYARKMGTPARPDLFTA